MVNINNSTSQNNKIDLNKMPNENEPYYYCESKHETLDKMLKIEGTNDRNGERSFLYMAWK